MTVLCGRQGPGISLEIETATIALMHDYDACCRQGPGISLEIETSHAEQNWLARRQGPGISLEIETTRCDVLQQIDQSRQGPGISLEIETMHLAIPSRHVSPGAWHLA